MAKSRTEACLRNAAFVMVGSIVNIVLQFVSRRIFVSLLSAEYLGLNGLFSDILSVLALSELGVGMAMVYALYKPIADKNIEKIKSLMQLYKRFYIFIGSFIIVVGTSLAPFLQIFLKEVPDIPLIRLYYVLYVIDSGVTYFLVYKKSLIVCSQEEYITSTVTMGVSFFKRCAQIAILLLTHNYLLYLLLQISFSLLENVIDSLIANIKYPYLKDKDVLPLDPDDKKSIARSIRAMLVHKVGAVVVNSTDTLIVSKVLGLVSVGLYSNYNLIMHNLTVILSKTFGSLTASFGNLVAEDGDKEKSSAAFSNLFFVTFWVYSVCSVCMFCLFEPFIKWWLGDKYLLGMNAVTVFVTYFFLEGIRNPVLVMRNVTGLFEKDKYKAIVEAVVNIVVSIPLTIKYGILGVKLGTIISLVFVAILVEGIVLFKYYFKQSPLHYFLRFASYTVLTLLLCFGVSAICNCINCSLFLSLIIRAIICVVVPNVVIILMFFKTKEFGYVVNLIKSVINKKRNL